MYAHLYQGLKDRFRHTGVLEIVLATTQMTLGQIKNSKMLALWAFIKVYPVLHVLDLDLIKFLLAHYEWSSHIPSAFLWFLLWPLLTRLTHLLILALPLLTCLNRHPLELLILLKLPHHRLLLPHHKVVIEQVLEDGVRIPRFKFKLTPLLERNLERLLIEGIRTFPIMGRLIENLEKDHCGDAFGVESEEYNICPRQVFLNLAIVVEGPFARFIFYESQVVLTHKKDERYWGVDCM